MIFHTEPSLRIYFGDATNNLYPQEYSSWHTQLLKHEQFNSLELLNLKNLFFLKQIHSTQGKKVTHENCHQSFKDEGDFLITNESGLGLGIMTADCTPVIVYDKKHHAVGIAHAGWRGAVSGVVNTMIARMKEEFDTHTADCKAFLGPSAKKCCYQVDAPFIEQVEQFHFGPNYLIKQDDEYYFDLPGFIVHQLTLQGIMPTSIYLDYNVCTIDNSAFWSYRRASKRQEAALLGRQMTVVSLR